MFQLRPTRINKMSLIVVDKKITKEDIKASREDYPEYIKRNRSYRRRISCGCGKNVVW